ncbi:MAG: cytochrome D ubiquinol oxidase subunit II [Epsilonproteobacteria bacterium 4484_65]|nr:MAG: cytochrome D ubiquinol oxidase subunit II [Epsilonproteobacteria bacterium 4484_65]
MKKESKENNNNNNLFPWQRPKSKKEDPNAPKQVKKIMESPSYQVLEDNISFLDSDEARGIRLQLDYLRAEVKMQEHGIDNTIVVFGSTRIIETDSAIEKLKKVERELEESPHSEKLLTALGVAERMVKKSIYYDEARQFGKLVGESGKGPEDCRVTLMTGGGPGIMEAANRGAFDVGAKSIGLNIELPHEQFPNPYITPDLCFQFYYFSIRKLHFLHRAKALVIFPGGLGTFDELFEILTLIQTQKNDPIPVVLVGEQYWKRAVNFEFLSEEGVIGTSDLDVLIHVDSAKDAWEKIIQWYQKRKIPLF